MCGKRAIGLRKLHIQFPYSGSDQAILSRRSEREGGTARAEDAISQEGTEVVRNKCARLRIFELAFVKPVT